MIRKHSKLLLLIGLAIVVGVVLFFGGGEYIRHPSKLARVGGDSKWLGVITYCLAFIIAGSLGLPPAFLVVVAGLLWPFPTAFGLSLGCGMASAGVGFLLSRYIAHDYCARHIPDKLQHYNERLRRKGLQTVILLRLMFYLFPPVNWMLGLSRIRGRDYMVATFIGALPGTLVYTILGKDMIPWLLAMPVWKSALIVGVALLFFLALLATFRLNTGLHEDEDHAFPVPISMFLRTACHYVWLSLRSFFPPPPYRRPPSLRRMGMLVLFLPAFGLLQTLHWLALWLDEFLYPHYHKITVRKPVFIVGIPRSGTTFLHRVLAHDAERYTTLTTWELLFAPAICERKFLLMLARLDRRLGRPMHRIINGLAGAMTGGLEDVHRLALNEPEEDFLLLMPILACYILVVPFPFSSKIQDLAVFDETSSAKTRMRTMRFYRAMLKRHLFVHGDERTILSKNVSFTPLLASLLDAFPDARVIACMRAPARTIPSQISSMEGSWRVFGNSLNPDVFHRRWLNLMVYYYRHLHEILPALPAKRLATVEMENLRCNTAEFVTFCYDRFGLELTAAFSTALAEEDARAKAYRSRHNYTLAQYGLDKEEIDHMFAGAWPDLRASCWKPE